MGELLTAAVLATLSVSKLQEELKLEYEKDTLIEALALENAKEEPRKTAIDLLTNKINELEEKAKLEAEEKAKLEQKEVSYIVAPGKSVTTLAGIKSDGESIDQKHFKTKEIFDNLVEKEFITEVKI